MAAKLVNPAESVRVLLLRSRTGIDGFDEPGVFVAFEESQPGLVASTGSLGPPAAQAAPPRSP